MATATLAAIAQKIERGAARAMVEARQAVAHELDDLVQEGFETETDPYGNAWRPKATDEGKILHVTGELQGSYKARISGNSVEIGSSDKKARWHQRGTRPYDIFPKHGDALALPPSLRRAKASILAHVHHPGLAARRMLPDRGVPAKWRARIRSALSRALRKAFGVSVG